MQPADQRPQRTQIMTLAEMAKYLGVHKMTVYRMLQSGRLPGFKLGRQWRTKKDVLDAWLLGQIHHQQEQNHEQGGTPGERRGE